MRVLWITNQPIGAAEEYLSFQGSSGTWMNPSLKELAADSRVQLSVAFVASVQECQFFSKDGVDYYCVPRSKKKIYPYKSRACQGQWKWVVERACPDIIMIWGTEYAHGLCVQHVAQQIPTVIVIQGILHAVHRHYLGGMTAEELRKAYTFRNFLKHDSIRSQQRLYGKKAKLEKEMLLRSKHVLYENQWVKAVIKGLIPDCSFHQYRVSVKDNFGKQCWSINGCERHSIFCTAPVGYPLKGFHNMIKALAIIRRVHPEVVLRVPGMDDPFSVGIIGRIKKSGYIKHLTTLIEKDDLKGHIQFLGPLNSEQIEDELLRTNVFVLSSSIENQSMSLREAMAVGVPCVASFVGGVPESISDGDDGRLYRFEEYEQLADIVLELMEDVQQAQALGEAAHRRLHTYQKEFTSSDTLISIYQTILGL